MQKSPMILRRLISALVLTLALGTFWGGVANADDNDSSSGDITEEDCANLDESLAAALGCDTSDTVTDFTEYGGELEGPEAAGYDEALTQSENARDFIQQVVNYALGFLGLITTVIIIYGGVLYVTSRGDEEMATKGKKTISYAAIGILIIIGSFALVNTLIGAGGGEAGTSGTGEGVDGTTITEAGASFDVDEVLDELEDITTEYVDAYDTYLSVSEQVAYMKSLEMPIIVEVEATDASLNGLVDYFLEWATGTDSDYADQYQLIDEVDIDNYIDDLRQAITNIQSDVDSLSDTYEAAQALYNYLKSGTTYHFLDSMFAWFIPEAQALTEEEVLEEIDTGTTTTDGCATRDYTEVDETYYEYSLGVSIYETTIDEIDDNICSFITNIQVAADSDYTEKVEELSERFAELKLLFDTEEEGFTSGSSLTEILEAFDEAEALLDSALETENVSANTVREIAAGMSKIYTLVEEIEFVQVQLEASDTRGNAPLIVRFNILGTEDPSGDTVQDDQIQWDLDGDGDFDETCEGCSMTEENGVSAEDIYGDAVSATFVEPGTYRVRVRVLSSGENIAAGVSTVTIEVEPSKSQIVLTATAGGETTVLADFREFPETDQESYKVTMTEALDGITFDASETMDGDGNDGAAGGIVYYEWDFGDNDSSKGKYGEDGGNTVTHAYSEQGTYNVSLTVTDDTGVEDRKLFTLYVASPAARFSYSPESGPVGTTFEFDGSGSSTDVGQIVSYSWTASLEGTEVDLETTTGQTMEATFDEPGVYTVTLQVADNSKTDTASATILVESTAPVATYTYSVPESTQPATLLFDATDSYDPDEGDTITYEWDFDGVEDEDYIILDSADDLSEMTVQFLKTGDFDVMLTVYDQHEGELKKSDSATGTITIDSVLDVELEIEGETARHLDENGEAEVEFTAMSEVATAFEIDFGDGESSATENITNGQSIFTHAYTSAGVFSVTLTAVDDDNNTNSVSDRVFVGSGDAPIAVIAVGAEDEDIGSGEDLHGNIKTKFSFDASDSVNVDGSKDTLVYSWNFGDGVTASQAQVTHIFSETATYTVTLTVRDEDDSAVTDTATVSITIEGINPEINGISVVPQSETLETPLKVEVTVDASDEDGKITYVKGWYYDLNDTATALGTVISESTSFSITVNTKGESGEQIEYGFAAEVTDNDNNTVSSFDELESSEIPTLEVTNGPNESPVASFTIDKTSLYVGEELTLSSTSYDPDGEIVSYWWDIEGDGFYNNEAQEESSYAYTFSQVHPEGVEIALKVEDSSGATDESESITVFVDAISAAPDAAFLTDIEGTTVSFRNNSDIDTENGAELGGIYWDFDLATDSNGNGTTDDDYDSFEENPTYTYSALGTYQVQMTIVDSTGQSDSVSQDVNVAETSAPTAAFTYEVDDLTVNFENDSTFDEENGVSVRSYAWDLNLDADTDGDTDPENDTDATTKNPTWAYDDYGDYEVKLSVEDSVGKTDTVIETIEVPNPIPPLSALLTASPTPNSLEQVILEDDGDYVTFFYGAEGGSGDYEFELDKNIFYDTDGDGVRDNDVDYDDDSSGSWKTPFFTSYGQIVTKLTVTDTETGDTDIATLQVVFEGSLGGANLFNATPSEMLFLILGALLAAILGISMSFRHSPKVSLKK